MKNEEKKRVKVNGVGFDAFKRNVSVGDAKMEIEIGTTGFCGGDRDSGSRLLFRLNDMGSDCLFGIKIDEDEEKQSLLICMCGDEEILAFMKALCFACDAFAGQITGGKNGK